MLAGREEILRWLVWNGPSSVAELEDYYAHWHVDGEGGPDLRLALEERSSGALVGSFTVRFAGHAGQGDVGYWVGRAHQGKGFGREAVQLAAHLAFRHLGAQCLYAWVFVGNDASRRVLEVNGFTLARTAPARIEKHGARVDEWHFVLLASEWRRLFAPLHPEVERLIWGEGGPA
jgi:RimJ/RimL family protein N-acetyltransferase